MRGANGGSQALLSNNEQGGIIVVSGTGKGAVGIGINKYGNGYATTWDKNGYKQ